MKDTFIIRTEWYEAIKELDPVDKATIFSNLFSYHSGGDIILDTIGVKIVWKLIEPTLVRNIESYDRRSETSAKNGSLGGRPSHKPKNNQDKNLSKPIETYRNPNNNLTQISKPIETLSDSVYDNDSDYDSDYDSVIVSDIVSEEKKEKISVEISAPEKVKSFKQFTEQDLRDEIRRHRASFALQDSDLLEFFKYWTEKSASGRMRFQLERTWDTGGRLGTWQSRKKEFNKATPQQKQHDALTGAAFSYLNTLTS